MTIQLNNYTPFPNLRYTGTDTDNLEFGVFMAKVAFDIQENGSCEISEEQEPFAFKDEYYDEVNASSVRYPSDFVPYKPKTDIALCATAWAPTGQPTDTWLVGVKIATNDGTICQKALRIFGPRFWIPKWERELSDKEKANWKNYRHLFKGWELSKAQPITKLPIRYEFSYGGNVPKGIGEDGKAIIEAFEPNPIGQGYIDQEWTDHTKPVPAPQIEDPEDPVINPYKRYCPHGFGPIPPAWLPRRTLGGTYDQQWLASGGDSWPKDYDFEFHNSSHIDLRGEEHVSGALTIELVNLHPQKRNWRIRFENKSPVCFIDHDNLKANVSRMNLDSLFIEIDDESLEDPRVFCVWRILFHPNETRKITLMGEPDTLSAEDQDAINSPPDPKDVSVALPKPEQGGR